MSQKLHVLAAIAVAQNRIFELGRIAKKGRGPKRPGIINCKNGTKAKSFVHHLKM